MSSRFGEMTSRLIELTRAERPRSALLFLRLSFFLLLAYDLWLISLSHAPRYGAGGFNVAHLDVLSAWLPAPTPTTIGAIYLAAGSVSIWVAVGLLNRWAVLCSATLYSFAYYWSQADSYQHHYLLCLCLFLFLGEPWRASVIGSDVEFGESVTPKTPIEERCQGLSLDALMFQMALIYGWTALAKCEPVWLSGETLSKIVSNPEVRQAVESSGAWFGLSVKETFTWSAWGVMLGEWFAAIAFIFKPLRAFAFFVVPWFHIMVEWVGFDIELFSYYMILLNIALLSPSVWWRPADNLLKKFSPLATVEEGQSESTSLHAWRWTPYGSSLVLSITSALTLMTISIEGAFLAALIAIVCVILSTLNERKVRSLSSSIMISLMIATSAHWFLHREVSSSEFRFDYYRMWGGDLKRRGELREALRVYRLANEAQSKDQPARLVQAGELAIQLGEVKLGLEDLSEGARRRLNKLERQLVDLLEGPKTPQALREFQRSARSAQSAQQKLYRAYLRQRDPRAEEAKIALEATLSMIQQAKTAQ